MRTRVAAAVAALLLLLPAAGCGLKRAPAERAEYVLEAVRPDPQPPSADGLVLHLRTLRVSPVYENPGFVYHRKDGTVEQDFHNKFFVLPAYLITGETRQWLAGSGFIRKLTPIFGMEGGEFTLSGYVEELYGDYRGDQPAAVLSVQFTVVNTRAGMEIAFDRDYRQRVPVASGPEALVQGWNAALTAILSELESDLRGLDWSAR